MFATSPVQFKHVKQVSTAIHCPQMIVLDVKLFIWISPSVRGSIQMVHKVRCVLFNNLRWLTLTIDSVDSLLVESFTQNIDIDDYSLCGWRTQTAKCWRNKEMWLEYYSQVVCFVKHQEKRYRKILTFTDFCLSHSWLVLDNVRCQSVKDSWNMNIWKRHTAAMI